MTNLSTESIAQHGRRRTLRGPEWGAGLAWDRQAPLAARTAASTPTGSPTGTKLIPREGKYMIWKDILYIYIYNYIYIARKTRKSGEPWYICNWMSFTGPFLLGPVFFRTALPCCGGYHMERGGMLLHDVVGMNCTTI